MRVLHVIPSLSPKHGGPSVALPLMERALTEAGVSVETATTDDDGPGCRVAKPLAKPLAENEVIRWYFPKQTEFYKVSGDFGRWVRREVARFDVVHIHALFSYTSIAAARAARTGGVPYVIRPLGVLNRYGMTQRRALLKKLSFRFFERGLLRDAAAVQFTAEAERVEAESLGVPMRSVVIPLGIEFSGCPLEGVSRKPTILFLSRIDPKKNIDSLIDAWARLSSSFPNWRLQIAGSGDVAYTDSLKQLAVRTGVTDRIEWLGRVEGDAKARCLREAGVYVLPSFSENFGIAAVEAMGAGIPCLLSSEVAVGKKAAEAGACVLVGTSAEQIEAGLRLLISNVSQRQELGKLGELHALREYSLAAMGTRLRDLYQEIAVNTKSPPGRAVG